MAANQNVEMDPCGICQTPYGEHNDQNVIEEPVALPCGHILGNDCCNRWFRTVGASRSCPLCRFPMRYPKCQHTIEPRPVAEAPATVNSPDELPDFCRHRCAAFLETPSHEEAVWERAQQNSIWLLQAIEHTPEVAERIGEQIDWAFMMVRTAFGKKLREYERQDFRTRW